MVSPYDSPEYPRFIAAIAAALDDDAPRERCADWLREHGEHDRADFIECQLELAKLERESGGRLSVKVVDTYPEEMSFDFPINDSYVHWRLETRGGFLILPRSGSISGVPGFLLTEGDYANSQAAAGCGYSTDPRSPCLAFAGCCGSVAGVGPAIGRGAHVAGFGRPREVLPVLGAISRISKMDG